MRITAGKYRTCRGVSVVELMLIVAIVSGLLATGIPGFISLIQNQRLASTANALFMAVNLARSEAIHRGRRVDLVPLDGQTWSGGWQVFIDENNNQRPDPYETVLYTHAVALSDLRIMPRFSDSKVQYIAFNSSGRSHTNASRQTAQSGHWLLEMGPHARKVTINFLGRPRVCNPLKDKTGC